MKIAIFCLFAAVLLCTANARSFNTFVRENQYAGAEAIKFQEEENNETFADLYFGIILGWQVRQDTPGQCYDDTLAFWQTMNRTLRSALTAFLPQNWFNFLDNIRVNIDSFAKSLQSCQTHTILTKLQRLVTMNGIIETAARLLTQIPFLQGYVSNFFAYLGDGNMTDAGIQLGLLSSAIIGTTVN